MSLEKKNFKKKKKNLSEFFTKVPLGPTGYKF